MTDDDRGSGEPACVLVHGWCCDRTAMEPLAAGDLYDLIVATNVFVYYEVFEQSLALANVAAMLRPGGVFLSNQVVEPVGGIPMEFLGHVDIPMEDLSASTAVSQSTGDRFFLYRRR